MIHTLLNLTRPLIVLDCETTGTDTKKDRVVELAFEAWDATGLTKEFRTLVNPGVPIPASATRVHGITDAMVCACQNCDSSEAAHMLDIDDEAKHEFKPWPRFAQLAKAVSTGFINCDFAGKRVRFDLQIVAAEMARNGVEWSYMNAAIVDADRLEALGDPRSLTHLVKKHLGEDMSTEAHGAMADVRWTTKLIVGQLKAYPCLPRDLDALHKAQWPDWIDSDGSFRMLNGVATCMFGKHKGTPMKNVPRSYYDWILSEDFAPDVKQLARDAKLGKFPEAK